MDSTKREELEITDQEDKLIRKLVELELEDDGIYDLFTNDVDELPEINDDDEIK